MSFYFDEQPSMEIAQRIVYAFKTKGFMSAYGLGPQGIGKSRFALHMLYSVYKDWDMVKQTFFFEPNPESFKQKLQALNERHGRVPCIALDDMGTWFIKYEWNSKTNVQLYKTFNLIRNRVSGVIATALDQGDVVKYFRGKFMYEIFFTPLYDTKNPDLPLAERWVTATGYKQVRSPDHKVTAVEEFSDKYNLALPEDVQQWEWNKREEVLRQIERAEKETPSTPFQKKVINNHKQRPRNGVSEYALSSTLVEIMRTGFFKTERSIDDVIKELQVHELPVDERDRQQIFKCLSIIGMFNKVRRGDEFVFIKR